MIRPLSRLLPVFLLLLSGCSTEPAVTPSIPEGGQKTNAQAPSSKDSSVMPQLKPPRKDLYDENADAGKLISTALQEARQDHKHVLIQWGGNWCSWCLKLHALLESDRDLKGLLRAEYVYVPIDSKNVELAASYNAPVNSVPFLTVLNPDNKVLVNQPTEPLEEGDHHDPARVKAFLEKWKPTPQDAEQLLTAVLDQARQDQHSILVHFGAPWCTWCKRLEKFLNREDIAPLIAKDFINLKIDLERMNGGESVYQRIRKEGQGIPWFAILNPDGEVVASSDSPSGNIGFPVTPDGIEHFIGMLNSAGNHLSDEDKGKIRTALEQEADQILTALRSSGRLN